MSGVVVVDYGMGNLGSVAKALEHVSGKVPVSIAGDKASILAADRVVFPGQGAMPDCMRYLRESGLLETVLQCCKNKPLFGVCVGEQMLFDVSEEGNTPGLGVLAGSVKKFKTDMKIPVGEFKGSHSSAPKVPHFSALEEPHTGALKVPHTGALKVPHMGWNKVSIEPSAAGKPHPLWSGIPDDSFFYFVHSYYVAPSDARVSAGSTQYGERFTSAIARDNIFATQFHPEKSAALGLQLYQNFLSWKP